MESFTGLVTAVAVLIITILCLIMHSKRNRNMASAPLNWPIFGMVPSLLWNLSNFHEWAATLLIKNGGTLRLQTGICTTKFDIITSNPLNLEYILAKCKISPFCFADAEKEPTEHQDQQTIALALSGHYGIMSLQKLLGKTLLPALEEAFKKDVAVDLQELLFGFGFDYAYLIALGKEHQGFSVLLPELAHAFGEAIETWAYALVSPSKYSNKYMAAIKQAQELTSRMVVESTREKEVDSHDQANIFSDRVRGESRSDKSLQDLFLNTLLVSRNILASVLCWFFWVLSKHPNLEDEIMLELSQFFDDGADFNSSNDKDAKSFDKDELNRMQYLETALIETVRLYPPFPLGHARVTEGGVLPDGTSVEKGWGILYSIYGANRMGKVWGDDAMDFKPERWDGERICVRDLGYLYGVLGMGLSSPSSYSPLLWKGYIDMIKCVAANILIRYHVGVDSEQIMQTELGMSLRVRNGMQVTLNSREEELQAA